MKSMKVIIMEMLALVFGLSGCRNTGKQAQQDWSAVLPVPSAARITMDKLPEVLRNVQAGRTEFDFTGICSNGTDCIYFMQENGKFYIDFEAMSKEQLPYLDSLKRFAGSTAILLSKRPITIPPLITTIWNLPPSSA